MNDDLKTPGEHHAEFEPRRAAFSQSLLFNFLIGTAAGIVTGGVLALSIALHVITARVEAQNHAASKHFVEMFAAQTDSWNAIVRERDTTIADLQERAARCETAAGKMNADLQQRDFRDRWYTLVYEPEMHFAPNAQAQALAQFLDLARPGLGAVLANLQSKPQPGMQLRIVLHGYVKAEAVPAGMRLVYTLAAPDPSQVQ